MGIKNNNFYRFTHRQPGQAVLDHGVRVHRGNMGIDVEEFYTPEQDAILEGAAKMGLPRFVTVLRMIAPVVGTTVGQLNSYDELRQLFLDPA